MPTFEDLRLKVGQLITPEWYDRLVEHLTNITYRGAVTYYGDVYATLRPHPDLALNLGVPDLRFLAVYAGYGYFDYDLYARGYRVLTEVDPITIERDLTKEPILLAQKFEYLAPDFSDVFDPDLIVQRSGRVRAQFTLQSEAISYLKVVPSGTTYEMISALAGASHLSPYAWHEFDLTVQKDDGVNVRFSPPTIISIRVYNIGST